MATENYLLDAYNWLQGRFATALVNLVIAIIIILVGFMLSRLVSKLVKKILKEIEFDKLFKSKTLQMSTVLAEFIAVIGYITAIFMAMKQLGLYTILLEIILGIIALIIIFSLLFWLGDLIPNLINGIRLHNKLSFAVGDNISAGTVNGKVVKMTLKDVYAENKSKETLSVPYTYLWKCWESKNMAIKKMKKDPKSLK